MRTEKIVVRLNAAELRAVKMLADLEKLPPSTLARRLLLKEADKYGLETFPAVQLEAGHGDCVSP